MLEIILISLAVLLAIVLGIGGWFIGGYNTLAGLKQNIKTMTEQESWEYRNQKLVGIISLYNHYRHFDSLLKDAFSGDEKLSEIQARFPLFKQQHDDAYSSFNTFMTKVFQEFLGQELDKVYERSADKELPFILTAIRSIIGLEYFNENKVVDYFKLKSLKESTIDVSGFMETSGKIKNFLSHEI